MPRILVLPDDVHTSSEKDALMNERVVPEHLSDAHSANQLIERLAWAICDASDENERELTSSQLQHAGVMQ